MTDEQTLALPKSHPARFLHFYGSRAPTCSPPREAQIREFIDQLRPIRRSSSSSSSKS